jgi:hypothetical protein
MMLATAGPATLPWPSAGAIKEGQDYTLIDENGAHIEIRIDALKYGKQRTAEFTSITGWKCALDGQAVHCAIRMTNSASFMLFDRQVSTDQVRRLRRRSALVPQP